jgi:fatty-acyl-CoA synthase
VNHSAPVDVRRAALQARFPRWQPRSLGEWLDTCAAEYADRPMVLTDNLVLTYSDVAEQSREIADGLLSLGVQPGDRVGMVMANHPEFAVIKFAIARTGAIAVPLNYLYRADELQFVVSDAGCRVVITMTEYDGLRYPEMLRGMSEQSTTVLVDTDGSEPEDALTLSTLAALGRRNAGACDALVVDPLTGGDMLYTSGTTGSPKGVLVTHDAVLRTAFASALTRAYEDGRRILFSLPCYHMFGYIEGLLSAMYVGGAIIPQTKFSPRSYFDGIQRHRATDILCVPTMAVALLEDPCRDDYDLSSLNAILCGSAPAPVWLWNAIEAEFGVSEIVTGYGMTECGGAMTLARPEDDLVLTSETVGRPKLAGSAGVAGSDELVVYKTVDPESGHELPPGAEGELVSRGPTVMLRYWNRPAETAAALKDGWLHSGDLGRVSDDGYIRVTGRSKELYKSGGELVMPKEIEDLLDAHEGVSQSFAVGLHDERWGELGCVVVVRSPGSHVTEAEIIEYCRERLARFKVPKRVVFYRADELPTTPTGKVQKFRLIQELGATPWEANRP